MVKKATRVTHTAPQPFLGSEAMGAAATVAAEVIFRKATELFKKKNIPVPAADAERVAGEVAKSSAEAVVKAIKDDPDVKVLENREPLSQSINLWLGVGTILTSLGGVVTLYFNGTPDTTDAYMAVLAPAIGGVAMIVRRATLQQS